MSDRLTNELPAARPLLRQLIAQVGIVEAGILLRRHVIALERITQGIDPITEDLATRLAQIVEQPQ